MEVSTTKSKHERITEEYCAAIANRDNKIDVIKYSRGPEGALVTIRIEFGYGVIPPDDGVEDD